MTGMGYSPACDVTVQISRPDSVVESFTATTDFAGNLEYDYLLPPPPRRYRRVRPRHPRAMRVLAITNLHPTSESPGGGAFIAQQIESLRSRGIEVEVMFFRDRRHDGPWVYYRLVRRCGEKSRSAPDLIHVMYGGVMAAEVTRQGCRVPVIVNFHGSDLLGENLSGVWRKIISHYGVFCSIKAARRAQGVIVVSRNLLDALNCRVSASRARVIPCGIDLQRFKPLDRRLCQQELGWPASQFHVLFVSSSGDPVKRPELARSATEYLGAEARIGALFTCFRAFPTIRSRSGSMRVTFFW